MKAVILAGGRGVRLWPLTKTFNKHTLPVGISSPMIWYPLWSLKRAGITEVLIVTDRKDAGDIIGVCGSGKELGMDITYRIQDQAGGVAEALGLAKDYVMLRQDNGEYFYQGRQDFICILGDNVFTYDLLPFITKRRLSSHSGCQIASARVKDPLRYALIAEDANGYVANIVEKPKVAISDQALTGIAIFDQYVFDIIESLTPSARNELEYTDVLNKYIKDSFLDNVIIPEDQWVDAGTFSGMERANKMVSEAKFVPFPDIKREDL